MPRLLEGGEVAICDERHAAAEFAPNWGLIVTDHTNPAGGGRRVAPSLEPSIRGPMDQKTSERKREPSLLALQLADAFAPCAQWSEVRVERGVEGRRTRVIVGSAAAAPAGSGPAPFDWATGAL